MLAASFHRPNRIATHYCLGDWHYCQARRFIDVTIAEPRGAVCGLEETALWATSFSPKAAFKEFLHLSGPLSLAGFMTAFLSGSK
jgi:hypothetical protein